MSLIVQLGPAERDESRPFAHIEHNAGDLQAMSGMAAHLRDLMLANYRPEPAGPYQIHEVTSFNGRRLRMVVVQPARLMAAGDLAAVGFFGHRRPAVAEGVRDDEHSLDTEMIDELPKFAGVLSYCTLELSAADYGNLVLMASPDTSEHWRTSARHAYAARVVAPAIYTSVRLHNGVLPGGLLAGREPYLTRTKYFDFQTEWPWHAVREYAPA